jgi:SAM-dependent methyltransferase
LLRLRRSDSDFLPISPYKLAILRYTGGVFLSPIQVLRELPLKSHAKVGDFGTGAGHYALALAKRLSGGGTVYAIDAFGPGFDSLRREAAKHHSTFYTLESDLNKHIPLKSGLLDAAVVANVLHQITDRKRFVSELARVMVPGGTALIIDWAGSFKNMGPVESSVLSPAEAAELFRSSGFEIGNALPAGTHHFAFLATNAAS